MATGRFLTMLHESALWFATQHRLLKVLPVDLLIPPMPIIIFRLKNRTVSPVVQLFVDQGHAVAKSLVRTPKPRGATAELWLFVWVNGSVGPSVGDFRSALASRLLSARIGTSRSDK
ncbi:hypothetical protein XH97_18010 [Bradyrhizobium sp. CCBAU 53380]|nr:hypothetical protein [Bradyrhizobium sp. CCBAU 53380]